MNVLGLGGFTNLGYHLHARTFQPVEASLAGKTVVITGGTGGLGLAAARTLTDLGARVLIVGRSEAKLAEVAASVNGDVGTIRADLSLRSEVRGVADRLAEESRLDVLINNVGVLMPTRMQTREGLETTFATNLAGHFLLTNLLIPRLIDSAHSRIINVTSGGMYSERIRPDDLQSEQTPYRGAAYARTKRAQVILTEMWADRLEPHGVVVHAMHPGWAKTAGVAQSLPGFNRMMGLLLRTPEQGADTMVWLAAAPEAAMSTGQLWFDRSLAPTHLTRKTVETAQDRRDLWAGLVALTDCDLTV